MHIHPPRSVIYLFDLLLKKKVRLLHLSLLLLLLLVLHFLHHTRLVLDCFAQLFGSKILIANVELRFPLFQVLGIGKGYYGILPIDFTAFFDAGLAWFDEGDERAFFLGGNRKPVSSIGVGLRMNVFGYLIVGVSFVRPFDRPNRSPYFQFTLTPGF